LARLFRRGEFVPLIAGDDRRISFRAFRSNNNRKRKTFGAAAVAAQGFVCLLTASAFRGDFLQLLFKFFFGQFSALKKVTCIENFLDVKLIYIASAELTLGVLASSKKDSESTTTLLQSKLDLLSDLVVIGDRFFRFAGERDPN
jgi:hypothetical protein